MKTIITLFLLTACAFAQTDAEHAKEIQAYIRKTQAGLAGQNPRDVTAARSGDPEAIARVEKRDQTNRINQYAANGSISETEKLRLLSEAESQHEMRRQALEQERLMSEQAAEMRREMQILRQQQQEMIIQQQRMEQQRRWEMEQRSRLEMQRKLHMQK